MGHHGLGLVIEHPPVPRQRSLPGRCGQRRLQPLESQSGSTSPPDTYRSGRRRHRRGGRWGQWGRRQQWWILVVRFRLLPQPTQFPLFRRNLGKKKWHPNLACPCPCTGTCLCTRPRGRQYPERTSYTSSKRTTTRTRRTRSRSRSRRTRRTRSRRTSSPSQPVALPSMDIPQSLSTRLPSSASQSSRFATTVTPVASRPRSHCGRTTHC